MKQVERLPTQDCVAGYAPGCDTVANKKHQLQKTRLIYNFVTKITHMYKKSSYLPLSSLR